MTISVATSSAEMERLSAAREGWRPIQATICGGGNGAHVAAGFLASCGIRVNVFTRQSKRWGDAITLSTEGSSWEKRGTITGALNLVTGDASQACAGSEVVIIAAPANAHPDLLRAVAPFVDDGAAVGALFAQGGFDWACVHSMGSHVNRVGCLFGLQNIPWICRINEYGKSAVIVGPKKKLYVASYPVEQRNEMALRVEAMFDIPCGTVPNFLNLTLTPSNQILHPARYYGIFWDWDGTKTYSKAELEERKGLTLCESPLSIVAIFQCRCGRCRVRLYSSALYPSGFLFFHHCCWFLFLCFLVDVYSWFSRLVSSVFLVFFLSFFLSFFRTLARRPLKAGASLTLPVPGGTLN
ncbi:unnamed protein product [Ectocarpus sp. 8 AP-2014]